MQPEENGGEHTKNTLDREEQDETQEYRDTELKDTQKRSPFQKFSSTEKEEEMEPIDLDEEANIEVSIHGTDEFDRYDMEGNEDGNIKAVDSTLRLRGTPLQQNSSIRHTIWIGFACFFIVVATVLGTGILALPVNVGETGFAPFMITISICYIAQLLVLLFVIELLQRTQTLMELNKPNTQESEYSGFNNEDGLDGSVGKDGINIESKLLSHGPDLHTMAKFFLNRPLQIIFECAVILHFVSLIISYSLAGPEAYAQLFNVPKKYELFIFPFVLICTLIVILGHYFMQYIITGLTIAKGSLLVILIFLVGYVATQIREVSTNSWQYIGRPFLIGTVALGGAMNTLPVIYAKMIPTRRNIIVFQACSCAALTLCYILNALWCYFVLQIVPQKGDSLSLQAAKRDGQISTGPIIEVIKQNYSQFNWLATVVSSFVTLSVTVSFITVSSGMKHMLDGYVKTFHAWQLRTATDENNKILNALLYIKKMFDKIRVFDQVVFLDHFVQLSLYLFTFGIIWILAQINYHQLFAILEIFTSCALNLESGFFIGLMLYIARKEKNSKNYQIALTLPNWFVSSTLWIVIGFFLFAVLYDFVYTILRIFISQDKLPF
jgi:amino acid permease